jgi:hypothetical protein
MEEEKGTPMGSSHSYQPTVPVPLTCALSAMTVHPLSIHSNSVISMSNFHCTLRWKANKKDEYRLKLNTELTATMDQFNEEIRIAARNSYMVLEDTKKLNNQWYDKECCLKCKQTKDALKKSRVLGSPNHLVKDYHECRIQYKMLIRDKKESHLSNLRLRVNSARNPSEFLDAVKSFRRRPPSFNPISEQQWKEFYDSIAPKEKIKCPLFQGTYDAELDREVTKDEVQTR